MEKTRTHYIFSGRVQGVGFRYRMYYAAMNYGVTGWVRNLYDGTVEAELEGDPRDIASVLRQVQDSYFVSIDDMKPTPMPVLDSSSFEVR